MASIARYPRQIVFGSRIGLGNWSISHSLRIPSVPAHRVATRAATSHGICSCRYSTETSVADQINLIKQLRERTSAPIKDVKSALVHCEWNIEEAQKDLRKSGKVLALKRSNRFAAEGLLAVMQSKEKAAVIELNCETDFVAKNEIFESLALSLAKQVLLHENVSNKAPGIHSVDPKSLQESILNDEHSQTKRNTEVQNAITEVASITGENVTFRRAFVISASPYSVLSTYLHTSPQPGLGRIAGIVSLETKSKNTQLDTLQHFAEKLAMHIVASKPLFLEKDLVEPDALDNECEIIKAQTENSGKNAAALEKIVEGRLRKFYEEVVLLEQKFIMNDTLSIKELLYNLSKEVGSPVKVENFMRLEVGEGVKR